MEESYTSSEELSMDGTDAKSTAVIQEDDTPTASNENFEATSPPDAENEGIDYEALIVSDINALKAEFPELGGINDITDLNNPLRYAALRDLGLSPAEAYLATAKRRSQDTRSHLKSARGRSMAAPLGMMSQSELMAARELFPGMNDSEIQQLYKRVTK